MNADLPAVRRMMLDPDELTSARLQEIADGPIMDPISIYLPAGRLSESEYRAREARIMAGESK